MNRRPCLSAEALFGVLALATVAGALLAMPMPVRAQAVPACPWIEADPVPPPRPLDSRSIARLMSEADKAYRERRDTEAIASLRQVVGQDPSNERAWLRLGNLLQRTGRADAALAAYARAASVDPANEEPHRADRVARAKASLNFAMLSLQRAQRALARIDASGLDEATRAIHAELQQRVGDVGAIDTAMPARPAGRGRVDRAAPVPAARGPKPVVPVEYVEPPAGGRSALSGRTASRPSVAP